jgi:tripartite-type tricarboxylate transporter receptor subunit TctC
MNTFFTAAAGATGLIALVAALSGAAHAQQPYPSKLIRIILPYAAGASTDALARIYGQKMHETWGQPVVYDYKPGGNTIIGSEALTKAAPDGYTMLLVTNTHSINSNLSKLPYDPIRDFAPVATIAKTEYMLVVHPSVPAKNLKEFIAFAKSRPGQLNYSSSGAGGLGHLSGELFNVVAGVKTTHVPFKGGAPSVTALISGEVQMIFLTPINVMGQIRAGKVRPLAISGNSRAPALPEVPTFAEAGLPKFQATNTYGILMPAGTPRDIVQKVSAELNRIQALPDIKAKLTAQGMEPYPGTPEQYAALIKSDLDKFARIIKAANIKLEN